MVNETGTSLAKGIGIVGIGIGGIGTGLSIGLGIGLAVAMGSAHAQEVKGDAKAAEGKIAMCIGCHGIGGYKSSFPEVYHVPKIGGQSGKYIEAALIAYRKGDRSHPTMTAIAGGLSDQDIADLAAYYASKK
jgi:cytochrome c553